MKSLESGESTCRVALLFDGWRRLITAAWTDGIREECKKIQKKTGNSVDLVQYQCWGNASLNRAFNQGEYAVFDLPDLSSFDGIIVDVTNIVDEKVRDEVIDRIRKSGVPAVSLCFDVPGLLYAGVDGRSAERTILEHLYTVHGCRSFFFAGGPKDNYENLERFRAFEECMEKHQVPEDKQGFCFGTYEAESGTDAVQKILASESPLPDAIVCANDNIAVGVILEAQKHGIRVPQDVKVTGFDCLDKAMYFDPQITSAELSREKIGSLAMRVLYRKMQKEAVEKYSYVDSVCHFAESCGCPNTGTVSYRSYLKDTILYGIKSGKADDKQALFESELMECQTFEELRDCVLTKLSDLGCDGAFLVLDERLTEKGGSKELPEVFEHAHLRVLGGFEKEAGQESKDRDVNSGFLAGASEEELLEYLRGKAGTGYLIFVTPLHLKEQVAGYLLTINPRFLLEYEYIYRIHEHVLNTLQEIRDHQRIVESMHKMKALYERDRLTGVYQRAALKDRIEPAFSQMLADGSKVGVCFADADLFKEMNDTRGHEFGDRVLRRIAHVMDENLPGTGYVCRYGGDEFLAILEVTDGKSLAAYRDRVENELLSDVTGEEAGDPVPVRISMGMVLAPNPEIGTRLDDFINAADRQMYTVKAHHHTRG